MPFVNPYRHLVEGHDLLEIFQENALALPALVAGWPAERWASTYAPGKRSANEILLHLLHVELVDGYRLRMALSDPAYVVQPFDPDAWLAAERDTDGPAALAAWRALRKVNLALLRAVPKERWTRPFVHPEAGEMTIGDLAGIWSGHELHHLAQLTAIDRKPAV